MPTKGAIQLENQEKTLAYFVTTTVYRFIEHTNKKIGNSKVHWTDVRKYKNDGSPDLIDKNPEFYRMVCTKIMEEDFVEVSKEVDETTKEEIIILKVKYPWKSEESIQNVDDSSFSIIPMEQTEIQDVELTKDGKLLLDDALAEVDRNNQDEKTLEHPESIELENIARMEPPNPFTDVLNSLKREDSVELQDPTIVEIDLNLEKYSENISQVCEDVKEAQLKINQDIRSKSENTVWKELKDSDESFVEKDEEFEAKLEKQKRVHQEKLEEAKRKREEKQKAFQKELDEIRKQQNQCFITLLNCIQLRHRFEEKKQEVADWIKLCYRDPVVHLLKYFQDYEEFARNVKQFKKVPEEMEAGEEVIQLNKRVYILLGILFNSFNQLGKLILSSPDAIFLQVLQKFICEHVLILHKILDKTEETQFDHSWYLKLCDLFSSLQYAEIPTTKSLRKICQDCFEIENLKFPEREIKSSVAVIEVLEESNTYDKDESDKLPTYEATCKTSRKSRSHRSKSRDSRKKHSTDDHEKRSHRKSSKKREDSQNSKRRRR
ncbi:hypothetical protein L5515_006016 [Caenorhabditis briggsae]|uniref:Uncharacterized protein n=1 Tax=Caenorhabditis briggsae TaxID=6238 RepID=A0AAE9JJG5_CAEBR|nr:hypothetical protein L5515_006016 [Caenorhabditis briggsae]